jgi:hypothetical protein
MASCSFRYPAAGAGLHRAAAISRMAVTDLAAKTWLPA